MTERDPSTLASGRTEQGEDSREERLRAVLTDAYPALETSAALRARVAGVLTQSAAAYPRRRPSAFHLSPARLGWALATAAVLVGIAAPILWPRWVGAQTLRRIGSAIDDVMSAHEVYWRVSADGRRNKAGETWYQAGGGAWLICSAAVRTCLP